MRFTFFLGGGNEKIIDKIRGLRKKNMILLEEGRRHDLLITVYLKKMSHLYIYFKIVFLKCSVCSALFSPHINL